VGDPKLDDDELNDDLAKIPYKSEHGLSKEEQIWLSKWFEILSSNQVKL
jgi:hypothetical protein